MTGRKRSQEVRYDRHSSVYEAKLARVMARLGVEKYDHNFDRFGAWVQFHYKGQFYRFEQTIQKAEAHGVKLTRGTDCLAQLVLTLEDLARMTGRGLYDLQTYISGMRMLPEHVGITTSLHAIGYLGFRHFPENPEEVHAAYRELVKTMHPDAGGNPAEFIKLQERYREALALVGRQEGGKQG